jgi:cysteine desulfurase
MPRVYLDYAATTPLRPQARTAMLEALDVFGNPSSVHQHGQAARYLLDDARRRVADALSVRAERVVFCSGGTEANNLALRGVMAKAPGQVLLVSSIEHDCVRQTALALQASGVAVEEIPAGADGVASLEWLQRRLQQGKVALVSLMHANNETGVLQPVAEAAALARQHGALLHTDAVQTVGHLPVAPDDLGTDLLTFTAHKFGGPKGTGALVLKSEVAMLATQTGGAQERNRRGGTENLAGAVGLAAALGAALGNLEHETRIALELASYLENNLPQGVQMVAPKSAKVPHVRQLHTPGRKGEDMVMQLDVAGVAVSQGSACSSGRVVASHVLQAMGFDETSAGEGLRLSWGWNSQLPDVKAALAAL